MTRNVLESNFKQSPVGVIPSDWATVQIRDVANVIDSLHRTPSFTEIGYPMVRVADIKTGNLNLSKTLMVTKEVFLEFTKNHLPEKGNIVLSRVGSYGVSSYVDTVEPFCIGQNTVVITSKIPSRYLYYILNSPTVRAQIEDGSYGSGYKSLSLRNINELRIPLPSTHEQTAIANALSDVDALIQELEKLIAKKQAIKTATMQQLLTGRTRLPPFGFEKSAHHPDGRKKGYKPSELGEIPEDWSVISFGETLSIRHGKNQKAVENPSGTIPILATGGQIGWADQFLCDKPSVLIGRKGTIDKPRFSDKPFWTVDTLFFSEIKNCADAKFIYYKFCMVDWMQYNEASGVPSLNASTIERVLTSLPVKEEQLAIAHVLSAVDEEIDAFEQRLNKTRQIKQGMMQELLTGKTRLVKPAEPA